MNLRTKLEQLELATTAALPTAHAAPPTDLRNRIWSRISRQPSNNTTRSPHPERSVSEEELYQRLIARDPDAFDEVAHRHLGFLLAIARKSLDHADAEDAVQNALLTVITKADRWDARRPLRALLFGVLRLAIRKIEAANLRAAKASEVAREQLVHEPSRGDFDGFRDELAHALLRCTELEREVILYWLEEEMNPTEIAPRLGLEASHVRVLKMRALGKLRPFFEGRAS